MRAFELQRERNVFPNSAIGQQIIAIEHHADFALCKAQVMTGKRRDIAAVNYNAAGLRSNEHVDASQKRAFSGPGASDDGKRLAFRYVK